MELLSAVALWYFVSIVQKTNKKTIQSKFKSFI